MKRMAIIVCLVVFFPAIPVWAQTKTVQPGPEYNVLNAWTGDWAIQGEAKDTESGPAYKVYWTLKGQRILGGFFLEVHHRQEGAGVVVNGLEVTGYDPIEKTCTTHVYNDDGSLIISKSIFISERTVVENGMSYFPDGNVYKWRTTWNFGPDWKSLSVKQENDKDGTWWTSFEAKGVRNPEK